MVGVCRITLTALKDIPYASKCVGLELFMPWKAAHIHVELSSQWQNNRYGLFLSSVRSMAAQIDQLGNQCYQGVLMLRHLYLQLQPSASECQPPSEIYQIQIKCRFGISIWQPSRWHTEQKKHSVMHLLTSDCPASSHNRLQHFSYDVSCLFLFIFHPLPVSLSHTHRKLLPVLSAVASAAACKWRD